MAWFFIYMVLYFTYLSIFRYYGSYNFNFENEEADVEMKKKYFILLIVPIIILCIFINNIVNAVASEIYSITPNNGINALPTRVQVEGADLPNNENNGKFFLFGGEGKGAYKVGGLDSQNSITYARRLSISGNYAYLVDSHHSLHILDVSNPTNSTIVGSCDLPENAYDVFVLGNYAYLANFYKGLQVVDISSRTTPEIVGECVTSVYGSYYAKGVYVAGDYAYLAYGNAGLHIMDITDPINPIIVGICDTPYSASDVYVADNLAYVADGHSLQVIDVTDPTDPRIIAVNDEVYVTSVYASGAFAYVATSNAFGFSILDVMDCVNPAIVGTHPLKYEKAVDVSVQGNYAYVLGSHYQHGLNIIDISDPACPKEAGQIDSPNNGEARSIHVSGPLAYIIIDNSSRGWYSFSILDIRYPETPRWIGSYRNETYEYNSVYVQGTYAYIAAYKDLQVMDISDPSNPDKIGTCTINSEPQDVFVLGDYAYVATLYYGLRVVDISNPGNCTIVGSCETEGNSHGVYVSYPYAYIADNDYLQIVDISDPTVPIIVGSYWTVASDGGSGDAYNVYISDNFAYVANRDGGLEIVDISDPTNPFKVLTYEIDSMSVWSAAGTDDYIYIAGHRTNYNDGDLHVLAKPSLLVDIEYIDFTTISATVPAGLSPGPFNLHLISPEVEGDVLPGAFTSQAPDEEIFIDDGHLWTSSTGNWTKTLHPDSYGPNSLESNETGAVYLYEFIPPEHDFYEVFLWWTAEDSLSRCPDVPVKVYNGQDLMNTLNLNQQENGGQWNSLGLYFFNNTAKIAITSPGSDCKTCVDGIKFDLYGAMVPDYITIEGPARIPEMTETQYTCRAHYPEATSLLISPDRWKIDSPDLEIDVHGLLSAHNIIGGDQNITITAHYQNLTAQRTIKVIDNNAYTLPEIYSIIPNSGSNQISTDVAITGKDFQFIPQASLYGGGPFVAGSNKTYTKYIHGWRAKDVHVVGNYAYIVAAYYPDKNSGLKVMDISDSNNIHWVGYCPMEEDRMALNIYVAGNYAYIGVQNINLSQRYFEIFDISDPTNPTRKGACDLPGTADNLYIQDNYAYIADGSAGMHIIDISDPITPHIIGTYNSTNTDFGIANVHISEGYAYLACRSTDEGLLEIVDINDPDNPDFVGSCPVSGIGYIDVSDSYAYVTAGNYIQIIDITDPVEPEIVGSCPTSAEALKNARLIDIYISGQFAYTAYYTYHSNSGINVIDISDPMHPYITASCLVSSTASSFFYDSGPYAYVITYVSQLPQYSYIRKIDITNPINPSIVSLNHDIGTDVKDINISAGYGYMLDNYGLEVLDIADPINLSIIGSCQIADAEKIEIKDNCAYILNNNSLKIVDITSPNNPAIKGSCAIPVLAGNLYYINIYISGSYAYITAGHAGLQIIDISVPSNPTIAGEYDTPGIASDVRVVGDYAFVTDRSSGLQILDIHNPSNPSLLTTHMPYYNNNFYNLCISGNYAYISTESYLEVIDISIPCLPKCISCFALSSSGTMRLVWPYIYITAAYHRLVVMDITNPIKPSPIAWIEMIGAAHGLFATDENIYIPSGNFGLQILERPHLLSDINYTDSQNITATVPDGLSIGTYNLLVTNPDGEQAIAYNMFSSLDDGEFNSPPTFDPIGDKTGYEGSLLEFTVTASDIDLGDSLTYIIQNMPPGASFNSTLGLFSWLPDYDQTGVYTDIIFNCIDDGVPMKRDTERITITIEDVNRPPIFDSVADREVTESYTIEFNVSASDPDGDNIASYFAEELPQNTSFNGTLRLFSWTPDETQAGNYTIRLFAQDDGEPSATGQIDIAIQVKDISEQPPELDHIRIEGPESVDEASSMQYVCRAYYNDLSFRIVEADNWSEDLIRAEIDTSGLLISYSIITEESGNLTASYQEFLGTKPITILDIDIIDPTIYSITPDLGNNTETIEVNISGENFLPTPKVALYGQTTPYKIGSFDNLAAYAITISGNYAYSAKGTEGLKVLDITDRTNPVQIGNCTTTLASGICISGDYAYIADQSRLLIIDITDPTNPVSTGWCQTSDPNYGSRDYSYDVSVSGDYAYVTAKFSGLKVIDISNSTAPEIVGTCDKNATIGITTNLFVLDSYAYVADGEAGLQIVDITDAENPSIIATVDSSDQCKDVYVQGQYAYVADGEAGLQIVDVSNPATPHIIASYETFDSADVIYIHGNYAYIGIDDFGLKILDISDPLHPMHILSEFQVHINGLDVIDEYVYIADYSAGLVILDLEPDIIRNTIGVCDTPDYARGIDVVGDYAYITDRDSGLQVMDVSDVRFPHIVGSCETPASAMTVCVSGDYAYVGYYPTSYPYNYGICAIDISDPTNPTVVGSFCLNGPVLDIDVSGDYAYVVQYYSSSNPSKGTLYILDISDPTHITSTGSWSYRSGGRLTSVQIVGNYAYVTNEKYGLFVLNVIPPSFIRELDHIDVGMSASQDVYVAGNYAYLDCNYDGFFVIDISNPNNLYKVSRYLKLEGRGLYISGDIAYFGNNILDVSEPANPRAIFSWDTISYIGDLFVSDDYFYVVHSTYGLSIVEKPKFFDTVIYLDSKAITASVPVELRPGLYNLHVINPDGGGIHASNPYNPNPETGRALLRGAFTSMGEWPSNQPPSIVNIPDQTIEKPVEIHVCPGESIQDAIDLSGDGTEIIVHKGTYYGTIVFNGHPIELRSENPNDSSTIRDTVIDGEGLGSVVIFNSGEGSDTILHGFTITNGYAEYGGGVYCDKSSPTIIRCTFYNNTASSNGGGIYINNGSPAISRCIISENKAENDHGGGIWIDNYSTVKMTNSIVAGNYANFSGGGIYCGDNCTLSIINCSSTLNKAAFGGGIFCKDSSQLIITNSIFWDNTGDHYGDEIVTDTTKALITYSDIDGGGYPGEGNIDSDPFFINPTEQNYRLLYDSPCIDQGINTDASTVDLDGIPRPQDGDGDGNKVSDIGAYEYIIQEIEDEFDLKAGWQMFSLPVNPTNKRLSSIFDDNIQVVYGYEKGYGYVGIKPAEELEVGQGYWILTNNDKTYSITGSPLSRYDRPLPGKGWYMAGSITKPGIMELDIGTIDVIYGYKQGVGYQRVENDESIQPGEGYWVLVNNIPKGQNATLSVIK